LVQLDSGTDKNKTTEKSEFLSREEDPLKGYLPTKINNKNY
jgi:hypothetical protein